MTSQRVKDATDTAGAGCNCKAEINAKLAERNTQLMCNLFNERDIFVETIKLDEKKRGKRTYVFASFCPFCGASLKASGNKHEVEEIG